MTLRDVHDRCVTCGRPPSEECCEKCHQVALTFERAYRENKAAQATHLHPPLVNTEAVNQ